MKRSATHLQVKADVRLVAAKAAHSFPVRHDFECSGQLNPLHIKPDLAYQTFNDLPDFSASNPPSVIVRPSGELIAPGYPRHLQIDLGELRLSVLAPIFVTETARDLIIPVDRARCDEQLFGLLG